MSTIYDTVGRQCICVDPVNGIFLVRRTVKGRDSPIHVQKKTGSSLNESWCELGTCMDSSRAAARGQHPAFECEHLQAVQNSDPYVEQIQLDESVLETMVMEFSQSCKKECKKLYDEARGSRKCPVYPWLPSAHMSQRWIHYSVYTSTTKHYWCKFNRCVVSYDTLEGIWKCACCPSRRGCIHKAMAKWFSFQAMPEKLHVQAQEKIHAMKNEILSSEVNNNNNIAIQ